jgi:cbb3-type cytochrome oxidase subunit 3
MNFTTKDNLFAKLQTLFFIYIIHWMFFTPFRIKNAQSLTNFPLKNAQQVGVFNEKWCN